MLVRVVRTVLGTILLLFGLPLVFAGGALWFAMQHQAATGGYTAALSPVATGGHAVVVSDVDALLRQEAPFARGDRTTLRLTAETAAGQPAFVGLAPATEVGRYLADVPYARVDQVRLARGPLPVGTVPVEGGSQPAGPPAAQPFWVASSAGGTLEWNPYQRRGEPLALVMMSPDGAAPLAVEVTARVHPRWLPSTAYGMLALGGMLVLVAVVALAWPGRPREVVYVVPPGQLPQVAASLGVPLPREAISAAPAPAPARAAAVAIESGPATVAAVDGTPPEPVAGGTPAGGGADAGDGTPAVAESAQPVAGTVWAGPVGAGPDPDDDGGQGTAPGQSAGAAEVAEPDRSAAGPGPAGPEAGSDAGSDGVPAGGKAWLPAVLAGDPPAAPFQWPPAMAGCRTATPVSVPPVVPTGESCDGRAPLAAAVSPPAPAAVSEPTSTPPAQPAAQPDRAAAHRAETDHAGS